MPSVLTPKDSSVGYRRSDLEGYPALEALALDISWSWSHCADKVWETLDRELWDLTKNPWVILQTVSREKLEKALSDPAFRRTIERLRREAQERKTASAWFQEKHPSSPLTNVAYFSMEFMLSEALPIYSGGLGNVAGDQLKAASDLGVPAIGIGLLYQQGYFRQLIDSSGNQQALYPYNDPGQLPIMPLRKANGEWLRIEVPLPGWSLWLRTWRVKVGRVDLYLLDSNDAANYPAHRGITSELYGGGTELRLKQEIILGIGGWRLLQELGIKPEVCHLNEGHAAFLTLDRARSFMIETGQNFDVALSATRVGNLFTTHTAVAAGFDRFSPDLIVQFLGKYATSMGLSMRDLLALGRLNPDDSNEPFNMAYLAIRGSGRINAVSRLHADVSKKLFEPLFQRWPEAEVPISYVTNGVHAPTWDSAAADELWTEYCGKDRWLKPTEHLQQNIDKVAGDKLWNMRCAARKELVDYARERLSRLLAARGAPHEEIEAAKRIFDPNTLTLGFARRFATYKRPNLLLRDPERFLRILSNPERPVQLIVAGKAHPADGPGQALIHEWMEFIRRPEVRPHVIFLSDYDMQLTMQLVQGVDVWVNTPKRPWEACGTSGMKVLVNGGLNLSELDGWWAEAYTPEVGWAIGDGREHGDDPAWDSADASSLYDILEHEIVPCFYTRGKDGMPTAWLQKMRASMALLTAQYSANRSVREYTESHYVPAAVAYRDRATDRGAKARDVLAWEKALYDHWPKLRFGDLNIQSSGEQNIFEVQLYLGSLDPKFVQVQLYADGIHGGSAVCLEMKQVGPVAFSDNTYLYRVIVPATRPAHDFTPRVIPRHDGVSIPLEAQQVLWRG